MEVGGIMDTKMRTQYRAIAFGVSTVGRVKKPRGYAVVLWNPDNTFEPSRLKDSGTFQWNGLHAVRRAAIEAFQDSAIHQVSIRTNRDRALYIFNRRHDGTIKGYATYE